MNSRDHKISFVFCACCVLSQMASADESPTAWDYSPVGECVNHFDIPKPSGDYPVTVQREKNTDRQKNKYVWIWDPTPAKNPIRQLVRITPKKVGCTVLFMPYSEFHDFRLAPRGTLPAKVTSTSATINDEEGGRYFEQEYIFDKSTGFYQKKPSCYEVKIGSKERRQVNCGTAIGD
jgi:hypothetical protein